MNRIAPAVAALVVACSVSSFATAADDAPDRDDIHRWQTERRDRVDRFRQLEELLPTPNDQRNAAGAPGHRYWQQKVDYIIDVSLDDDRHLRGSERITYTNHSPDTLRYLWLQVDANYFAPDSGGALTRSAPALDQMSPGQLKRLLAREVFDGSARITRVVRADGRPLAHTIVDTMMRVDLPEPLAPNEHFIFEIDWHYRVNRDDEVGGRTAAEWFEDDGNYIYEIAQWFPRLCQYSDVRGWHHKQFLGRGEFSLEFGDYEVNITVPADHIVASTGVLQNPNDVLTSEQRARLDRARGADEPQFIVTPDEARANEAEGTTETRTWTFHAKNVRDFAFASSRKFIWDAMLHSVEGRDVWAMSYYPNEGEPLWSRYSTHAIAHTLDVYSRLTFPYPYPVAISVNGPVGGMEYPMICFNGPRPEEDGTYSKRTKYGLISVIIHEVGHNFFPMIVNSDERQWTWMDEGLNTFCQFVTEQEWEPDYPSRRGEARNIVPYMRSERQVPIMTNSESLLQFGNNAYAKPATALNILRETILGREQFDFAFREYARRWMFRNPMPADFFRTMEDASGTDLDWFWRGWFYTTDHVDLAITEVREVRPMPNDPDRKAAVERARDDEDPESISDQRNAAATRRTDRYPTLLDFYNDDDEFAPTSADRARYERFLERLEFDEAEYIDLDLRFYAVEFKNIGGIPMPLILRIDYADGTHRELRIPAEIWAKNDDTVTKLLIAERPIARLELDPHWETADIDVENNVFPREVIESRFDVFKRSDRPNRMQLLERKPGDDSVQRMLDVEEDPEDQ